MATSTWPSSGLRVVMRCSARPGKVIAFAHQRGAEARGQARMHLVGERRDDWERARRGAIRPATGVAWHEREHDPARDHEERDEVGSAPDVDRALGAHLVAVPASARAARTRRSPCARRRGSRTSAATLRSATAARDRRAASRPVPAASTMSATRVRPAARGTIAGSATKTREDRRPRPAPRTRRDVRRSDVGPRRQSRIATSRSRACRSRWPRPARAGRAGSSCGAAASVRRSCGTRRGPIRPDVGSRPTSGAANGRDALGEGLPTDRVASAQTLRQSVRAPCVPSGNASIA